MRWIAIAAIAVALAACSAKAPDVEDVTLPSGAILKVIAEAPVPDATPPTVALVYQTDVPMTDKTALHDEALKIWKFFRFEASARKYTLARLTAQSSPEARADAVDFHFKQIDGTWHELDSAGHPIEEPPVALGPALAPLTWMLGTWNCDFRSMADKFATGRPTINIDEAAPGGATLVQTYSTWFGKDSLLGETDIAYDATRKVWTRHTHQTPPDSSENEEAAGPYTRDMTFAGTVTLQGSPTIDVRKRVQVAPDGRSFDLTTTALIGGTWKVATKGSCRKVTS